MLCVSLLEKGGVLIWDHGQRHDALLRAKMNKVRLQGYVSQDLVGFVSRILQNPTSKHLKMWID